jgi:hypothetical protein
MPQTTLLLLLTVFAFTCRPTYAQTGGDPAGTQPAETADRAISGTLVLGPQYVNRDDLGRGRARFDEFRDVPQGFAFEFARIVWLPVDRNLSFSATAMDVGQHDQRYLVDVTNPGRFRARGGFTEMRRFYSSGSRTLWSGIGSPNLTVDGGIRQGAESLGGPPNSPFASPSLQVHLNDALANAPTIDIESGRKNVTGGLEFTIRRGLTLDVNGDFGTRDGTRPLGFGTYIRRQALTGVPGTGAGFFWRESIEARGSELLQPVDHRVTEGSVTLTWSRFGHVVSGGWFASAFRNDASALFFDNPFEAPPGRASATVFTPASDQEPAAPFGNNNLRGLFARSVMQLDPDNDYRRVFANATFKLPSKSRVSAVVARGTMTQDEPFLPYAENDQVVSSEPGQPLVLARNAPLPRASLDGKMTTTQVDVKGQTRFGIVAPRVGIRYFDLEDDRPTILFPGYSSSGDAYFRRGIGQTLNGQKALFNVVGGYTRQRFDVGTAVKLGAFTIDAEYVRTAWDYDARQVDKTTDDAVRGTLRFLAAHANVNVFYLRGRRDFEGSYDVGLETSGVRAYDVWTRHRDQFGAEIDLPLNDELTVALSASYWTDEYPGAVNTFVHGYGLQDSQNGSFSAGLAWARDNWSLGAWTGFDRYDWNSLQVTKTSLTSDYNAINRWTRESSDDVFWIGLEGSGTVSKDVRVRADVNWQQFSGDWITTNLSTPDVNSAVAYPFPELSDRTLTVRGSLVWAFSPRIDIEGRYWFEPYRLDDFTWDVMQPYMQGSFEETRSSPSDVGDMNVSRFLFLDSRYADYTAHVVSALVHLRF